jgi:hypothetical protein
VYLFLKEHLEGRFPIECETAGDRVQASMTMWQKIKTMIEDADFVIGDCTGNNENVTYEIGLAHGFNREVILITSDDYKSLPTDLSAFEAFRYTFSTNEEFIHKLDAAVGSILESRYGRLYEIGQREFLLFQGQCGAAVLATKEEFISRLKATEAVSRTVTDTEFMSCLVNNNSDAAIAEKLVNYIASEITARS